MIARGPFFKVLKERFGPLSQPQVDGFGVILDVIDTRHDLPLTQAAYVLATAWHETAQRMQPVRETLAETDAQAIARLDKAWRAGKLPQVRAPYWRRDADGKTWLGRGFVQLTHKANYLKAEDMTGIPFAQDPELACEPRPAAAVLVLGMETGIFTGRRLSDYLTGRTDYVGARRIINGADRALHIANHALKFEEALRAGTRA